MNDPFAKQHAKFSVNAVPIGACLCVLILQSGPIPRPEAEVRRLFSALRGDSILEVDSALSAIRIRKLGPKDLTFGGIDALSSAISRDQPAYLEKLIDFGFPINGLGGGPSPLMLAVSIGSTKYSEILLRRGASLASIDMLGCSVMHYAARCPSPTLVGALLAAGADVHAVDRFGRTPLHDAASWGRASAFRQILAAAGNSALEIRDMHGWTALHDAVASMNFDCIDAMVTTIRHELGTSTGSNASLIELARTETGQTPLHLAARDGSSRILRLLAPISGAWRVPDMFGRLPEQIYATQVSVLLGAALSRDTINSGTSPVSDVISASQSRAEKIVSLDLVESAGDRRSLFALTERGNINCAPSIATREPIAIAKESSFSFAASEARTRQFLAEIRETGAMDYSGVDFTIPHGDYLEYSIHLDGKTVKHRWGDVRATSALQDQLFQRSQKMIRLINGVVAGIVAEFIVR